MEESEMEEMLGSMWPEEEGGVGKQQFNVERPPGRDEDDMLEEVTIPEEPSIVDFKRLLDLTNYSEKGSSQMAYLVKSWEYKQANAVRLLREELLTLTKQRQEVELEKLHILEEEESYGHHHPHAGHPVSILDDQDDIWGGPHSHAHVPHVPHHQDHHHQSLVLDDSGDNWKLRAAHLEKLLEKSHRREQLLTEKLHQHLQRQSSPPVEELSQILKRADNFLHFVLQNAPVVIGHQDHELRYRFIYNHFPSLQEDDIIGKTDLEIFTGAGVKESQDFKREVLEKGIPAKREITFETELFGSKTFLIYVEPVFSKSGDTIGINYMGMDVTDQVRKREKMAKLRETIAVQKAKETELNKSIHITEETMRAKQMLATMSHEIRSPLSGVVSIAEILSTTKLDREQRQLLDVMLSSGDLVLQLINDILDLSKVESGVMKLETTKFRPREVVKHVLQTAAASLQKILTLEGHVADDVPIEVIGDVLRIRQILTNLISNAVKFTHDGKVGIKLYTVPTPSWGKQNQQIDDIGQQEDKPSTQTSCERNGYHTQTNGSLDDVNDSTRTEHMEEQSHSPETTVWIRCDVYDTGIGIPENALPTLFKRYMQVSADHARKYGGTGLGLAICKQLVELMGGRLTVCSREHFGSTFTFVLPYKLSNTCDSSDDADEISDMANNDAPSDDATESYFQFQPHTLGSSLINSNGSGRNPKLLAHKITHKLSGLPQNSYSFPSSSIGREKDMVLADDACLVACEPETSESDDVDPDNGNVQCRHDTNIPLQSQQEELTREVNVPPPKIRESQRQEKMSSSKTEAPDTSLEPKILLVEDNKINVMVTQSMMKQLGHSIDVVSNGIEAVRAVQRRSYSLVLMDVHMPLMNGLEATRLIRSFEETGSWEAAEKAGIKLKNGQSLTRSTKRIPIIAMTANALSESGDQCYENGMDSFVSKPVTFQKLKQCLEQHLSSQGI